MQQLSGHEQHSVPSVSVISSLLRVGKQLDSTTNPPIPVELPLSVMLRHLVCLGASGSGKTVACKVFVEEMLMQRVPGIAIDPQGDIASMLLPLDPSTNTVNPSQDVAFREQVEVVVWTPGSTAGIPLSLDPLRLRHLPPHPEERVRVISTMAAHLAALLGFSLDTSDGHFASAYLDLVLQYLAEHQIDMDNLSQLSAFLQNMPIDLQERADRVIKSHKRDDITRKLEVLGVGARRLLFHWGIPIHIETLLGLDQTQTVSPETTRPLTRLSVIYLNSLHSQEEKEFFVGQIAQSLYDWMLEHPAPSPQAFFYIDEIAPFLPPVRKPACKDTLKLLFKQARKYGICCLLASQNPGDVDYMALSQCGTWALGRMMVQQDVKKVEKILRSLSPPHGWEEAVERLPRLEPGQFLLLCPDVFPRMIPFQSRWLYTQHETLDEDRIATLMPEDLRKKLGVLQRVQRGHSDQTDIHASLPQTPAENLENARSSVASTREVSTHWVTSGQESASSSALLVQQEPESPVSLEPKFMRSSVSSEPEPMESSDSLESEFAESSVSSELEVSDLRMPVELPPSTYEAIVSQFFANCPGAYTAKELTHETALSDKMVRRAVQGLLQRGELVTVKVSRSQLYWAPTDHFAPTVGVVRPILTATQQADRERAFLLARKECASSLFGLYRRETVQGPYLQYLLLWRVVLITERERGLWRKVREPAEHAVYFHATHGDLAVLDDTHTLHFYPQWHGDLDTIQDLATFAAWQPKTPAELGFVDTDLLVIKSPQAMREQCERQFAQPIRHIRLVAIPYWCFSLCRSDGKKRYYRVDAVFGKPLTLPML